MGCQRQCVLRHGVAVARHHGRLTAVLPVRVPVPAPALSFFNNVNLCWGLVVEHCTPQSCPAMMVSSKCVLGQRAATRVAVPGAAHGDAAHAGAQNGVPVGR